MFFEKEGTSLSLRDQLANAKEKQEAAWKEANNPFSKPICCMTILCMLDTHDIP
jgi:hypothetical protein